MAASFNLLRIFPLLDCCLSSLAGRNLPLSLGFPLSFLHQSHTSYDSLPTRYSDEGLSNVAELVELSVGVASLSKV